MTVSTTINKIQYTGNGTQDTFAYTFLVLDKTHLSVYINDTLQVEGSAADYTVTGIGAGSGGNIVFNTGSIPANNTTITIIRTAPLTQTTDYVENDKFSAQTHEQALDKLTMLIQQVKELASRAVVLVAQSEYADLIMPDPEAGYFLQWKTDLSGLQNALALDASEVSITSFMETLLDDADVDTALKTFCVRQTKIDITDATSANEIGVEGKNIYGYNGDGWSRVDDIGKDETKGGITLASNGSFIIVDSTTLLSGNVVAVLAVAVTRNSTTTPVTVDGFVNNNDIQLSFFQDGNPGTAVDLTALVDTGNGQIEVRVTYITAT